MLRRLLPVLAAAALAACGGAEARPSCAHSPPRALLEQAASGLDVRLPTISVEADSVAMEDADPERMWLAVKWEGPRDGVVLLAECGGGVRAGLATGYTRGLRTGPAPDGEPHTVVVEALTGDGTGYQRWDQMVLAERDGKVRMLWSATVHERARELPTVDGEEVRRRAAFSADGDTVTVTGWRRPLRWIDLAEDWAPGDSVALPVERHCWSAERKEYRLCRGKAEP